MKKIFFIAVSIIIITGFVSDNSRYENNMESFKWMIGTWKMNTSRGAIMETWISYNDSSLAGESLNFSSTGQSKVLENLELTYRGKEYFYISRVSDQNNNQAVKFKITSHSEKGFAAENPGHDFPKRITYRLLTKDSIHAFIDGGPAMPEKKSDFYYSRYKN